MKDPKDPKTTKMESNSKIAPNSYHESDEGGTDFMEVPEPHPSFIRTVITSFRPDYILLHLDWNSFKTVARTWAQVWSMVFIAIAPTSRAWIGQATYLFQIFAFIAPSGGTSVITNIVAALLASTFATAGWTFSIIASAIACKIRGWPSQLDIATELILDGTCTKENIENCMTHEMFSGRYLSTRCSVIYAIALFIGVVLFGMLQKLNPLMRVAYIISMIVLIITTCYNLLIPFFAPMLVSWGIVKTMYLTFAVKIIVAILIFPETSSFSYFKGISKVLATLEATTTNNIRFFKSMKPSDSKFSNYKSFYDDIVKIRNMMIPLEMHASLSNLEVSYGRLGPGAIGEIRSHVKNFINVFAAFDYLYQLIDSRKNLTIGKTLVDRHRSVVASPEDHLKLFGSINSAYKPVGEFEHTQRLNLIKERLSQKSSVITLKDLDMITELLKPFFIEYMETNLAGLKAVGEWIQAANQYRFYTIFNSGKHKHLQKVNHEQLKTTKQELETLLEMLGDTKKIEQYFQHKAKNEETMLALISQASMVRLFIELQAKSLLKIVEILLDIDEHFSKPQIWTRFSKSIFDSSKNIYHGLSSEEPQEETPIFVEPHVQSRNPDASGPSNIIHVLGIKVVKVYDKLYDELLWFWIRSGILVVITAVPFMCKTTAGWYLDNKLVWIVIMCAVSTSQYTGDTIYMFTAKLVYSFFGCLVGMVAWYISAGRGHGNPYGYAVVTAILYLYMTYYRHFSVHKTLIPQILYPVSSVLVLGSSWTDGNTVSQVGNVGIGFRPAYTRFASVVIGLSIAFFASVIPKPKSSKVAIRKIIANVLDDIGEIHCDVSSFALRRVENPSFHITSRHDPSVERLRMLLIKLASTATLTHAASLEYSLVGKWPSDKYKSLQVVITDIVQLYTSLVLIFNEVQDPEKWITHIIKRAGWYDIDMNADLLATMHMCSRSLKWKTALPKVTQATLSLKHFDLLRQQWGVGKFSVNERFYNEKSSTSSIIVDTNSMIEDTSSMIADLHKSMSDNLDYDTLFSHDGNLNVVALIICHMIYLKIDEAAILTKSLVGEKYDLDENLFTTNFGQEEPEIEPMKKHKFD